MSIKIDKFEVRPLKRNINVELTEKTDVVIRDRETNKISCVVRQFETREKNTDLANKIIETIEETIDSNE